MLSDVKRMPPKRSSTSETPIMTQAIVQQMIAAALEAQAANMTITTNKDAKTSGTSEARKETNNHKRKFDTNNNNYLNSPNNYPNKHNNNNHFKTHNNHNHDHRQQHNRRQAVTNQYFGNRPLCERCTLHHIGPCTVKCRICNRVGHLTRNCRSKRPATGNNLRLISITCHACGEKGHYKRQCSKINNDTFHVSKKSLSDKSFVTPKKETWLDDELNFVEEPIEIMDREVKQLRRRCIPIVKVKWNSEFTWEREDQIRAKYPHLFSNNSPSSI